MILPVGYRIDGRHHSAEEVRRLFGPKRFELVARQRLVAALAAPILERPSARAVDIGCYLGAFAAHLARRHPLATVYGLDYFPDNVGAARVLFPEGPPFLQANVYRLPFRDASLDFVSLQEVLEHLDRPLDAVREINRVLKDHGRLVATVPNAQDWRMTLAEVGRYTKCRLGRMLKHTIAPRHEIFDETVEWNHHLFSWTTSTLHTLFIACGFTVVEFCFSESNVLSRLIPALGSEIVMCLKKSGLPQKALL